MLKENEEDPFDVFGGSDDDDDDDSSNDEEGHEIISNNDSSMEAARSLVEAANKKLSLQINENGSRSQKIPNTVSATAKSCQKDHCQLIAWESNTWPDPLYKADEILLVSSLASVGGGRGYVAMKPIPPGTLMLVESPMMTWPKDQLGKPLGMVSVQHLIKHPNALQLVHDLEDFYPTKEQVDRYHHQIEHSTIESDGGEEFEQIPKMIQMLRSENTIPSSGKGGNEEQPHNEEL